MIRPGVLLDNLRKTVLLRLGFSVYALSVLFFFGGLGFVWKYVLLLAPFGLYLVWLSLPLYEAGKQFALASVFLFVVLGVFELYGFNWWTFLLVFGGFGAYRIYKYWDIIKNAKSIARSIRKGRGGK